MVRQTLGINVVMAARIAGTQMVMAGRTFSIAMVMVNLMNRSKKMAPLNQMFGGANFSVHELIAQLGWCVSGLFFSAIIPAQPRKISIGLVDHIESDDIGKFG